MQNTTEEGTQTPTPWVVVVPKDRRKPVYITSKRPLFKGGVLPVRVATMTSLKGFAGDALVNAQMVCAAVNAWSDASALRARLAVLEAA